MPRPSNKPTMRLPLGDWKTTKNSHDLERTDYNDGGSSSETASSNNLNPLRNAAPHLNWKELLDMRGFLDMNLWRFAGIETIGTMLLTFVSAWVASHLGPLLGGIATWLLLTLLIYSFMATSRGHVNPMISFATFFALVPREMPS